MTNLRWTRRAPESQTNFDLMLLNPHDLDVEAMHRLLNAIAEEEYRKLTLSGRARREFARFFDAPQTPLRGYALALLSNWFLTSSSDASSTVAERCEALWDALIPARPLQRLSSPVAGENHIVKPSAFADFWARLARAQGETYETHDPLDKTTAPVFVDPSSSSSPEPVSVAEDQESATGGNSAQQGRIRAALTTKDGLHVQLEGDSAAMASFLQH